MYYILLEKSCWIEFFYAIVAFSIKSSLVSTLCYLDYIFKSKKTVLSQFNMLEIKIDLKLNFEFVIYFHSIFF